MVQASSHPKSHRAITEALRQRISNGDWMPGHAIPSRRHLAAEFGISPATMERAIVPLLADGTLRANDRSGTFVAELAESPNGSEAPNPLTFLQQAPSSAALRGLPQGPIAIVASLYAPEAQNSGQNDHWVREIVAGMESELAKRGHHTVFVNRVPRPTQETLPLADSLAQAVADEKLSGLALIAFDLEPREIENAYSLLSHYQFPIVSVVAEELSLPVPHVMLDNRRAGFQAAHYLLEQGHKRLTVLLPERARWAEERLEGVKTAVSRANLAPESITIVRGEDREWSYNSHPTDIAAHSIHLAFENGWTPDGPVICATDMVAMALMPILTEKGYTVGSQIPVLGFDDHEFSRDEGITTLCPPTRAMGKEAARLLLEGSENRQNGCQVRLCSTLIPRRSTLLSSPSQRTPTQSERP